MAKKENAVVTEAEVAQAILCEVMATLDRGQNAEAAMLIESYRRFVPAPHPNNWYYTSTTSPDISAVG